MACYEISWGDFLAQCMAITTVMGGDIMSILERILRTGWVSNAHGRKAENTLPTVRTASSKLLNGAAGSTLKRRASIFIP